jgi:hydrogenase-4 component E
MSTIIQSLLVSTVAASLLALGLKRITHIIWVVAAQGVLAGVLLFLVHRHEVNYRLIVLALVIVILKGIIMPWLIRRSIREARIVDVTEPYVGRGPSLLIGLGFIGAAFVLAQSLVPPSPPPSNLIEPLSLATVLIGLQVIVTRRKAVNQVLGYLMLENGILIFGLGILPGLPPIIEVGILLDLFVGVFVMGITIFYINRAFDHIDTSRMDALHDDHGPRRWPFAIRARPGDDGGAR